MSRRKITPEERSTAVRAAKILGLNVCGVDMLRSLAAPLSKIRFCPTGGLTPDNAMNYLSLPNVVCIGGSWMVSKKLVDGHQWNEIERLSHLAAALPRSH